VPGEEIGKSVEQFNAMVNLTREDCRLIMDNCFSNLFVTDAKGVILYANRFAEEVLGCPLEMLLKLDIYQLRDAGYVSHSYTDDAIRTKKQVVGSYLTKAGKEVATVSTPVFNPDGSLHIVVTYSREVGVLDEFIKTINSQQEKINGYRGAIEYIHSSSGRSGDIIAKDPGMRGILDQLKKLALTDSTIMLYGESGVGKEVIANFIQKNSLRKSELFFPINCATMSAELVESELFGYEKGAFTGANREGKRGLFDIADGGTIFMDEIGELSPSVQSKLLRILENGEYRRVGGSKNLRSDVRIIGATNRNLKQMVEEKSFRDDLYYRLNVFPITIPPLRQRPLDIDDLADHFLSLFNRKHRQDRAFTTEMRELMHSYSWPGNIRELRNTVERYAITGEIALYPAEAPRAERQPAAPAPLTGGKPLKAYLDDAERAYIGAVLEQCGGVVASAAEKLGVHRSHIYKKLNKNH